MLEIQNLTKHYHRGKELITAITNFSVQLDKGEFVAVQGPSGCGKSTLLLVAGGLLQPDEGTVNVDGQDLYAMTSETRATFRASHIGFVFQQFHLVPYLTVVDNVLSATLALPQTGGRDRALMLLEEFGLSHRLHHVPGELSTGERQRCALARALMNHPKLILADEPTGNLDEENAKVVLDHLSSLATQGVAVLLVTHDPQAANRAHRVVQLSSTPVKSDDARIMKR